MPGTNPQQYETRFCAFADVHVRPLLDRLKNELPRLIACAITDINGYLPTHISERSQPQGPGPNDPTQLQGRLRVGECVRVVGTRGTPARQWAEVEPTACQ